MVVGFAVTVAPVVADKPVAGLQLYVVAPFAVRDVLSPLQIVAVAGVIVTVGLGFTVTVTVAVFVHPFPSVPVTVYVVVVVGLAVTVAPVDEDKPVAGLQLYDVAPLAVSEVLVPLQIVVVVGATVTVGSGLTVTVTVVVPVHPLVVPETVYVVVVVGFAVTVAPVVDDNPVAGLQLYVVAPLAVSETLLPMQIACEGGLIVTTGMGLTVRVAGFEIVCGHVPPEPLITTS